MAVKLGAGNISKLYLGSTEINKAYLGSTLVYDVGGAAFDADYQAVLDYATTQGYTLPSAGQQILQNDLVVALKTAGVWSKLDCFYVPATDGDSDFATINWITQTFNLTKVNSPIFSTNNGFAGDSVAAHLTTGWNELNSSVNFTGTSASRFGWIWQNNTDGVGWITGCSDNLQQWTKQTSNLNGNSIASTDFTPSPSAEINTSQFWHLNKTATLSMNRILNGGTPTTHALSNNNLTDRPIFLLSAVSGGVQQYSDVGISVIGWGANLTAEKDDLYSAIQTYMTSL